MYGKLFEQMYDGTLGTKGPWQALVTFQQLIILADKNGNVDMTPDAISRRTTIPIEVIKQGLEALEQPDPESRSPALEGRRIVRLSDDRGWGWNIVNYAHYRAIRSQDERREYMRLYQQKRRARVNKDVNTSTGGEQNQPIAVSSRQYAVSSKEEKSKEKAKVAPLALPDWLPQEAWEAWLEIRPKVKAPNTPNALKLAVQELDKLRGQGENVQAVLEQSTLRGWRGLFPVKKDRDAKPDYSGITI